MKRGECFFSPSGLAAIHALQDNPVHFQTHSDGSCCSSVGVSSAACTLLAWTYNVHEHRWQRQLVAARTAFFDTPIHSLRMEAVGLRMASEILLAVLEPSREWPDDWHALASE